MIWPWLRTRGEFPDESISSWRCAGGVRASCSSPITNIRFTRASVERRRIVAGYEEQVKKAHLEVAGIGAMWFGGPNQALAGKPDEIRAGNDGIIALAAKHAKVLPIATVHPYDGPAAVSELERVAAKGIKVLKIHPHTQKFDPDDPRVLTLVQRAGQLGVIVLMDNANILPGD